MNLIPAIDLYGGKVVRLQKGDYDRMTVYSDDPVATAKKIAASGVKYLHTVDLEGARDGTTPNLPVIEAIIRETGLAVDVGGGIRNLETAEKYLKAGVRAVVLGTAAVTNPELMVQLAKEYPGRVAVGVDVKDNIVAIRGWKELSALTLDELLTKAEAADVLDVTVTDISKDGLLQGPSTALYARIAKAFPGLRITASGGVSSVEDLRCLKETGVWGAILGKAYYTGAVTIEAAMEACE